MSKYQGLYDFLPYFQTATEKEACHWAGGERKDDGVITMPYPVYDDNLTSFIDEVYQTDLMDFSYIETLTKRGLPISDQLTACIENADWELVTAILTLYVRQERFYDGLWATAVKDKIFYKLLNRMAILDSGERGTRTTFSQV